MVQSGILVQTKEQSPSLMNRVWESGSALVSALSSKFLPAPSANRADFSTRRAHKAIDSTKIHIRLLSNEGELPAISRIAESTQEPEVASYAVSYLVEHQNEFMLKEVQQLALSSSHASLPALISLFNSGETEFAHAVLMERLANGDYFNLISEKRARALLLLDVLGAVDEFSKSNLCFEFFPQVWHCLAERPEEQEKLLAEILGDLNPGGLRYSPDNNMIPQAVKVQALQLLHAIRPASYERSLWYASRDQDDTVAYMATMACTDHWQNEGRVPENLESFPMLDLNLLFHLSKLASTFKWKGPTGVMGMYEQWNREVEELGNLDPKLDPQRYIALKQQVETVRKQLLDITAQRLNALQPIVDAVTRSMGLPHAKIRSTDVPGVAAAYLVGTGTVEFSKTTLLDDKPLTEEFMSSMLHELGHMEQDVLIIRMIADMIGLQFGQHGAKLNVLFQHYADAIGYAPDSIFLLEVLRLRRDQELTPEEKRRAERLLNAAYDNVAASQQGKKLAERIERLEESIAGIESGSYDLHLLDCLRDEHSLQPLFENGYVPQVLIDEIRNCKAKVVEIVQALEPAAVGAGAGAKGRRGRFDAIGIAQEMVAADQGKEETPVLAVVERFRVVVSHMLAEEHKRLETELSEIRRSGYHEAEAYAISDRVEVIVKALRKGWYEFTS